MDGQYSPVFIILIIIVLLLGVTMMILARKQKRKPNYKTFFILGITWIPIGIAIDNRMFTIAGIVFMLVGLLNKSKWKKEKKWSELTPSEKKLKLIVIICLSVFILVGIIFMIIY